MTTESTVFLIAFVLVVAWLAALTVGQVRARRHQGQPVYRRMPDGRLRFEWRVGTAYEKARRAEAPTEHLRGHLP